MASEKNITQRFFDVCNYQQALQSAERQYEAFNHTHALSQNLMDRYQSALNIYLSKCDTCICPAIFQFPFLFFYRDIKWKTNRLIHTIDYYPYGFRRTSNRLTKDGFPYLLQFSFSHLSIQYPAFPITGPEVDELYLRLSELILNYPYNRFDLIMEPLRKHAPYMAPYFIQPSMFRYSSERNLYYKKDSLYTQCHTYPFASILEFDPLTKRQTGAAQYIPAHILKVFLCELLTAYQESPGNVPQIVSIEPIHDKSSLTVPALYFQPALTGGLDSVCYSLSTDSFHTVTLPDIFSATGYFPKTIDTPVLSKTGMSKTVHSFLASLVGENLSLLKQFICALTDSMLTDGSRFLVLHTKAHKKDLQTFFSDVLSPTAVKINFRPHPKAKQRTCLTLTQLTKSKHLSALFLEQCVGKCTVLVDDVLPSDASLSTLRKLISGKHITFNSNFAPPQHYYNRLCIVCVTDDPEKSEYFHKKFKATVIDFAHSESAASHNLEFDSQDTAWLYQTLIPYGLKLKTLQLLNITDPAPFNFPHTPIPPTEDECIHTFLDLCHYEADCLCTTSEVYDSYCQFLSVTHSGRTPSLTKTVFNKKFKELTKSKFDFKRPHKSRTGPSPYCYIGLKLPEVFSTPVPPVSTPRDSLLQQYLEHIAQYRIERKELHVKVTRRQICE